MNISARNRLPGRVASIKEGAVSAEVVIALPGGGELVSVITVDSARRLRLIPGKTVCAIVKSSDVMIACGDEPDCGCGRHG